MTNEKQTQKPLEILVVEDKRIDEEEFFMPYEANRIPSYAKNTEILKTSDGRTFIIEKLTDQTFSERLKIHLSELGYNIGKINLKKEWNLEDEPLISNYDVILSDLEFPTNHRLSKEEIKELSEKHKSELGELYKTLSEKLSGTSLLGKIEALLGKNSGEDIYESLSRNSEDAGFLPIGYQTRDKNRGITFYTRDLNHAFITLPLGIISGLISPQDISDVIPIDFSRDRSYPELRVSKSGKLAVGSKVKFDNWVKALETAIKYQKLNS